jgi:hypothetical protein
MLALAVAVLLPAAATSTAQSLAEVAKQEEARRKAIATPAKVLTNDDLKRVAPAVAASQQGTAQSTQEGVQPAAAQPAQSATPVPVRQVEPADDPAQQEEVWRKRITDARAALERTKVLLAAMQSRINALWADFTARDDPIQRAGIARDRQVALATLARLQEEEKEQTQAIADIEEEARRAGIPPGWLR